MTKEAYDTNKMCGMIAVAIISGANLILAKRAACGRGLWPRRVPARSRVPANRHDPEKCGAVFPRDKREAFARRSCPTRGSDGNPLATLLAACIGRMWRRALRPPSDSKNPNQKARRRFPGSGFEILAMMKICR
jgi:hypothetical protein